jgi:hypothetical protein
MKTIIYVILLISFVFLSSPLTSYSQDSLNVTIASTLYQRDGRPQRVLVNDDKLFVHFQDKSHYQYIQILDVSDDSMTELGRIVLCDTITVGYYPYLGDFQVKGNYLYASFISYFGIAVYNIETREFETRFLEEEDDEFLNIQINGDYLYAYQREVGLKIFDISNPTEIVPIGLFPRQNTEWDLATYLDVNNDIAVLGLYNDIWLIDVSDPTAPVLQASIETPSVLNVKLYNEYLIVNGGNIPNVIDYFKIFDITDPSSPEMISELSDQSIPYGKMLIDNNLVYIKDSFELAIIDISDLELPFVTGNVSVTGETSAFQSLDLYENTIFVAAEYLGIIMIDVLDPCQPIEVDNPYQYVFPAISKYHDPFLYVRDRFRGLMVMDVSEPYSPVEVDYLENPFWGSTNFVSDQENDYLIILNNLGVAKVIIEPDGSFIEIERHDASYLPSLSSGFEIIGNYAFTCTGGYLVAYDISDLSNFIEVGRCHVGSHWSLKIVDNYACTLTNFQNNASIVICDISDPANITQVTEIEGSLDGQQTLISIGVSNCDGTPKLLICSNNRVGIRFSEVLIYDLSDPSNIQNIGSVTPDHLIYETSSYLKTAGNYAFWDCDDVLYVIDLIEFTITGHYQYENLDNSYSGLSFHADYNHVFAAYGNTFFILDCFEATPNNIKPVNNYPTTWEVNNAYPNPFNPSVRVPFGIPTRGAVAFTLYNINGQQIFEKTSLFRAGNHNFHFNTSELGTSISSGMYFIKLKYLDQTKIQKVMLLK